jgi:hypothetical protein
VFFLGFAGVASQRVFAEEIKLGEKVVANRFNVGDRQLLLINDRRDRETFPIATVTSLTYALKAIGQKMNPDRDILFLALSSHCPRTDRPTQKSPSVTARWTSSSSPAKT